MKPLYKKSSTGKDLVWRIWVVGDTYFEEYGQIGGKMQTTPGTKCAGKNNGRANETTPEQQAISEARSKWEKKLKGHNYVEKLTDAQAGKSSALVEGGILPMLAHKFSEHGDKLVYPCAAQPKLDGHRCIAVVDANRKCTLWSRTRKQIHGVPHIARAVQELLYPGMVLDGELYHHDYRNKFEELTHYIRQSKPEPGHEVVQYHMYDMPSCGGDDTVSGGAPFRERRASLADWCVENDPPTPLVLVETREVQNEDELMLAFEDFLAQGYEGAIARSADGLYVNKRSHDLLKIKSFDDSEFRCVNVEEGKGKMAGRAIFVLRTAAGVEFNAKMTGGIDALKKYVERPSLVVGKMVTVKYQGLTNKSGVPRFPVALRISEKL